MSTPLAKRRRLNEASKTLHKPFKSPFRTPLKPPPSSEPPSSDPPDLNILNEEPPHALPPATPAPKLAIHQTPKPLQAPHTSKPNALPTPIRSFKAKPAAMPTPKSNPSLTREIISLRADIQILLQAQSLATSTKDENLAVLVDTWRTASRAAAEELFAGTRDRVNRMGGVGAWRDREKEQREFRQKWDKEEMDAEKERREEAARENGDGEGLEKYEEYEYADLGREKDGEKDETTTENDNDSFTMDMMLKTLNIDLKLIGYNTEAQRWDG
ncbi:hypothetical protein P154DRAFT_469146 [Amniculicola lignicola CBS 123094]|uniref:DNA repair protein Dds20/Mei5 n=1 Tax=Amniculicola lignicola CBS 123094 TaxID=1392246 RepID=A0A6A5WLZ2_9PLEO|nr:hypothetical protein P154DRAFT_469146 [Amniculicola lignicola CBS 123094]